MVRKVSCIIGAILGKFDFLGIFGVKDDRLSGKKKSK